MKRRSFLICGLVGPTVSGCSLRRRFTIGWDEQVQLFDGRVIVVKVKYTYERLGTLLIFDRYTPSILRETEFSFASDAASITFSQKFEGRRVDTLQHIDGLWYLVLEHRASTPGDNRFGPSQDDAGHRTFRLDATGLTPVPIDIFSDDQLRPNVLMDAANADVLADFNGTFVTLRQKADYLGSYPLDVYETRIRSRHDSARGISAPHPSGSMPGR